jgi:ABC-type Mn2+/Zn2+ transport system ATPase subunit
MDDNFLVKNKGFFWDATGRSDILVLDEPSAYVDHAVTHATVGFILQFQKPKNAMVVPIEEA